MRQVVHLAQGNVALLQIPLPKKDNLDLKVKKLICGDENLPFITESGTLKAIIAESYFSERKTFYCLVQWNQGGLKDFPLESVVAQINIVKKDYKKEKLTVENKRVFVKEEDLTRVKNETDILKKIYQQSNQENYFSRSFQLPLETLITSHYGTQRIYNKKKKSQHLGTDFRAHIGKEIKSSNDGVVVFSGDLFYTGNTIIIDHGLNIFTIYGHLSQLQVKENEKVQQGQIIGLSGATGRVNGPHLHWGVLVNGHYIDGENLTAIPL